MANDRKPQSALLLRHLWHERLSDQDRKTLVDVPNEVHQIPEDEDKVWDWAGKTHIEQMGPPVQTT